MQILNGPEIMLTENTLENIKIMAPFLDEASQNQVFGIMLGMVKRIDGNKVEQGKEVT